MLRIGFFSKDLILVKPPTVNKKINSVTHVLRVLEGPNHRKIGPLMGVTQTLFLIMSTAKQQYILKVISARTESTYLSL